MTNTNGSVSGKQREAATCRSFLLTCIFRETDGKCIVFNVTRRPTFEVIVLLSRQMCQNMNNYFFLNKLLLLYLSL